MEKGLWHSDHVRNINNLGQIVRKAHGWKKISDFTSLSHTLCLLIDLNAMIHSDKHCSKPTVSCCSLNYRYKTVTLTWDGEQCGSCWWQQHGYHNWNGTWAGPRSPPQGDLHTRHITAGFSEMLCAVHERLFHLNCSVHTVHTWLQYKGCNVWKWTFSSKTLFPLCYT